MFLDVTDLSGATDITKGFTIDAAELAYTFCADFTQSTVDDKAPLVRAVTTDATNIGITRVTASGPDLPSTLSSATP